MLTPEIIAKLLDGTAEEQRRLYAELLPFVEKAAHHVARHPLCSEAFDDLVQSGLLYLYENGNKVLLRWNPERASLGGFVRMVTRRHLVRQQTRMRPHASLDESSSTTTPTTPVDPHQAILVDEMLDWLWSHSTALDRRRFEAIYIRQRKPTQQARDEGVSVEAIYTWMTRLRRRLRREFPVVFDLDRDTEE